VKRAQLDVENDLAFRTLSAYDADVIAAE